MIIFLVDKPSELPFSTFGTNAKSFLLSYHYLIESKLELADLMEDLRLARQGIKKQRPGKGRRRKNAEDEGKRSNKAKPIIEHERESNEQPKIQFRRTK